MGESNQKNLKRRKDPRNQKDRKNRRKRMIVALKVAAMKNRNVVQKVVQQIRNQNPENLDQNQKIVDRNPKILDQNLRSVDQNRRVRNPKMRTLALAVIAAHQREN